jgi:hypothetical protein
LKGIQVNDGSSLGEFIYKVLKDIFLTFFTGVPVTGKDC